jgi:hypothetical protein
MKVWFLVFFAFSSIGFSMSLEDPQNNSEHLRMFIPQIAGPTFVCGQPIRFAQTEAHCDFICTENPCREACTPPLNKTFLVQADNCSNENVDIYSSISWSAQAPQLSTLKYGQTWIEEFLRSMDFFITPTGTFELLFVMPPQSKILVDENGDEHSIQTVTLFMTYKQTPSSPGIGFEMVLDMNKRGIEQLLFFGTNNEDYFFKRWGLLK